MKGCIVQDDDGTLHYSQDHEDGAAMRRLQDARPGLAAGVQLAYRSEAKGWQWLAWAHNRPEQLDTKGFALMLVAQEWGATIAEAADKCRESLRT